VPGIGVVGVELSEGRGHICRVESDQGGRVALLVHELVELVRRGTDAAAAAIVDVGVDLRAVHPQQLLGVVEAEHGAVGVCPGQGGMDLAGPAAGPFRFGRGPVGAGADEFGGPQEPCPGFMTV